jgi:flagellar basal-body rod modification protein FlgD
MQIDPSSNPGAAATASAGASNRIGLADNFDSFLKLLTAQLKSQDPLSPLDANQFTQQLVEFSGVEQALKTNDTLTQLVALVRSDQIARSIDYLGAEVETKGQTITLGGAQPAEVRYRLDRAASSVAISIYDSAGRRVATRQGEATAGSHSVPWNGRDQSGQALPDGLYRVEVAASDAAGEAVPVQTSLRGIVDGVEIDGDRLMLSVGGTLVPADALSAIRRPPPSA